MVIVLHIQVWFGDCRGMIHHGRMSIGAVRISSVWFDESSGLLKLHRMLHCELFMSLFVTMECSNHGL
jgi:hypothetical protein